MLLAAAVSLQTVDVSAQRPDTGRPGERGPGKAGASTLERAGLKVGQQMPDVTILDENGETFPLSRVKGKHAVLVFGCLT